MTESKISLHTTVPDLESAFRCNLDYFRKEDIRAAIKQEEQAQKREAILQLLRRAFKQKKLGAKTI